MNDAMLYPRNANQDGDMVMERFRMAISTNHYGNPLNDFQKIPGRGIPNSTEVHHTFDGDFHRLRFLSLVDEERPLWPGNKWYRIASDKWEIANASVQEIVQEAYRIAFKACEDYDAKGF